MIRRPPRSTLSSSSAASDVYKRQFLHMRIYRSVNLQTVPVYIIRTSVGFLILVAPSVERITVPFPHCFVVRLLSDIFLSVRFRSPHYLCEILPEISCHSTIMVLHPEIIDINR